MRHRSILFCLAFSLPLAPQHTHAPSSEKPAVLLPGVARYHHPITTRNPEAQAFFDQGLTMIYGFNRQILQLPAPAEKLLVSRAIRHYARSLAHLAQGRRAAATGEQQALETVRKLVPPGAPFVNNTVENLLKVPAAVLNARLAPTPAASIDHWKRAVAAQDALAYDEPAPWYYPVRESLGAALLRNGQAAQAEAVFREGLRRQPRSGRLLFGLLESLQAQNKTTDARFVRMEFDSAWKQATVKLRLEDL